MVSALISRCILLVFGTLFPAYRSYKAIKNKNVREYVKWMMYWIIFALFITLETFADIFISWLPLYYEVKIIFIIWLLSPATKGSSILYRKFVHPRLVKHEKAIDKYIAEAQKNGYAALMHVGRKGLNVASETIVRTATTGQTHLIKTLRRYNSMNDLMSYDETDGAGGAAGVGVGVRQRSQSTTVASFDPEEDAQILQRQYKSYRQQNYIREDSQAEGSGVTYEEDEERRDSDPGERSETSTTSSVSGTTTTAHDEHDISGSGYQSHTLPRMRKRERKPITEAFPEARVTRSTRSSMEPRP